MDEGTREDYQMLAELEHGYVAMTADRVIAQLAQATKRFRVTRSSGLNTACNRRRVRNMTGLISTGSLCPDP